MVGDVDGDVVDFVGLAAHAADGFIEAEESFGGGAPEGDDDLGLNEIDFAEEEGEEGIDFFRGRRAIFRSLVLAVADGGAELDDV